ncbi:phospholipid/cholesterol/gamma-HCH transport system substrate-binding protein [Parelusimicrobium proximum]|uniref:MlaD family protein n=1 Tax=Parelusimicrobium proximum TaxID=3228953 RepID=UPI003D16F893
MKSETKVGIFAFIGIILLGFSIFMLGSFSFTKGYPLYVVFTDVSGLPEKSTVRLSGVDIGKVKDIRMDGDNVVVEIAVKDGVKIYKDATFKIAATSIIGSKFLKVTQGSVRSGILENGDKVEGITEPPMDEMINQAMTEIKGLVASLNNNGMMGEELNATMYNIRQLSANMNELVAGLRPYLMQSAGNFEDITTQINSVMADIEEQEGLIGSLLKDGQMKEDIKESIMNLKEVTADAKEMMRSAKKFQILWEFDAYYNTSSDVMMSDLALKIKSGNGYRYYRAGVSNLGNKDNDPKSGDYTDVNLLDIRMGMYNEFIDVSAGMIRGAGGVEVKLTPFYKDEFWNRLTLYGSATDFGRNRLINGREFTRADVRYGADFRINKYFRAGVGMYDILELNQPYVKFGIELEDKDIASFFGLATVAAR